MESREKREEEMNKIMKENFPELNVRLGEFIMYC